MLTALFSLVGLVVVGSIIGAIVAPPKSSTPGTNVAVSTSALAVAATTAPPAPAPPPAPAFTAAQQQAIDAARGYLAMGQGFSKAGLMGQLTSSAGDGFSHHLAAFALAHVKVNWNHQAVLAAKGYLHMGQGFSYSSLVQQLDSSAGDQFTPAQARHGASVALR